MTLAPAKVPQHLELEDIVAWGCSAADLLCVGAGAVLSWWLYLVVPAGLAVQLALAAPPLALGLALGLPRIDGRSVRGWLLCAAAFSLRARVLVTGGRP